MVASRRRVGKNQITLARALSKFGVASRQQAGEMIREGKVSVNRIVVYSPNLWIDPRKDKILLNGRPLRREEHLYLAMHKPAGVVTTHSDERGRKTVYDLLPDDSRWLFPIGRLDRGTSGLLLFTNDTRFGDRVSSPLSKVHKTYAVVVDKPLSPDDRKRMESRFVLDDGTTLQPAKVVVNRSDPRAFTMTIMEGKNRQIRRMCEELGYEVRKLCRTAIGSIPLGNLPSGGVRRLTQSEKSSIIP
jgi:23S rRNA pseudouridine2605 synthase